MVYHVIGTMSGSSMDGLDMAYCILEENGGRWSYEIKQAACAPFTAEWKHKLRHLQELSAKELMVTHTAFGRWMGEQINSFIEKHSLFHQIHLISSHGHTVFHEPVDMMSFQMGDGASLAATTGLPVVSDLRNMDIALGGQGAPIVPIGEKLLWSDYSYFLNIGGISNITVNHEKGHIAFDICPANRVLNLLAKEKGFEYDEGGQLASKGKLNETLLDRLNNFDYYARKAPKSLSNEFGTVTVMDIMNQSDIPVEDKLCTMIEHIAVQLKNVIIEYTTGQPANMLITGGGAFNTYLIERIKTQLQPFQIEIILPDRHLIEYKEALVMALIGILRWREESNVIASVTGASRNSVGGALWMGHD